MAELVLVSGLPRSGTSMMMKMLQGGGLSVVTDGERSADEDNPKGYFELEAVKRTTKNDHWIKEADGKVVKVISELLKGLPSGHTYKVIFMRRKLDEVLASQKKMLLRRSEPTDMDETEMKRIFVSHLEEVESMLRERPEFDTLFVNYNRMVADPQAGAKRVNSFLNERLDLGGMMSAVEPKLYRNRA